MIERFLRLLDTFKENEISKLLRSNRELLIAQLKGPYFSKFARDYFADTQATGEPYLDFADEPRRIVQIKQLINALYHAEMAFIDLENVNLRNGKNRTADLKTLYFNTIHHAYQASYLLTHVDIDFMEIFGHEIVQLQRILQLVQRQADGYEKRANDWANRILDFPLSYNAGWYAGIAVDQMKPREEGFDYNFISKFSAKLPGYIQELRLYLHNYSAKISIEAPEINEQKLQELQENAIKIIFALDDLRENNFFIVFKLLKYISIVRHIISLTTSTFQQMVQFNETSQTVVRDNLAKLKYDLLPTLFALADRIEDEALLHPGTLSKPMMQQVKPLYDLLITYARKVVNFEARGKELLALEDTRFLYLRLDETHARLSKTRTASIKAQRQQQAFNDFYNILAKPEYQGLRLSQLPESVKKTLARHYRYIRPIIGHHHVDLSNAIIHGLTQTPGWLGTFKKPVDWYYNYEGTDKISYLLTKKSTLADLFVRETVTAAFHKKLNQALLQHVNDQSNLVLTPYPGDNLLRLNDKAALGIKDGGHDLEFTISEAGDCLLKQPAPLTIDQAFLLAQHYDQRIIALTQAQEAYRQFMVVLEQQDVAALSDITEEARKKLQHLYARFQPYFMNILGSDAGSIALDRKIITSLTDKAPVLPMTINELALMQLAINSGFAAIRTRWKVYRDHYLNEGKTRYEKDVESTPLVVMTQHANRAHYLLKKDNYSRQIADFRKSLFQFTAALSLSARHHLQPQEKGIPFPKLENRQTLLREPQQLLNIKRLFNALYYLEQLFIQLENLTDKSSESMYVYHLLQVYQAINTIYHLSLSFYNDPHSRLVCRDLMMKAHELYQFTHDQAEAYTMTAQEVEPQDKTIHYNGLWYALQAFMVIPEHVAALNYQQSIAADKLSKIRFNTKQIAVNIERIIHDSHAYFRLLLDTPVMYGLFMELKAKLAQFSQVSHDAVLSHLEEISSNVFARLLMETDHFEAKLALKPGVLATSMKAILDQFYQGLVEPLGLVSARHFELVFSLTPIQKRQNAVKQRAMMAELQLKQISPQREIFKNLNKVLKSYIRLKQPTIGYIPGPPPRPDILEIARQSAANHYRDALPYLKEAEKELPHLKPSEMVSPSLIDDLFAKSNITVIPAIDNIAGLVAGALSYYRGQSPSPERDKKILVFCQFHEQLEYYLQFSSGYLPSTPEILNGIEKQLIKHYAKLLPDLYEHQAEYKAEPCVAPRYPHVDKLLNGAQLPIPVQIPCYAVDWVAQLDAYYAGLEASYQFEKAVAEEQNRYLQTVHIKEAELNKQYKAQYLQSTFEALVKKMAERRIGLLHLHSEYEKKLHDHLMSFNQTIIEQTKSSNNIRKSMILLLIDKTRRFQHDELRDYMHLDKVLSAIQAFYLYLDAQKGNGVDETSVYEVQDLIDEKSGLLTSLKDIALNDKKSPSQRLQQLQTACDKVEFSIPLTRQRSFTDYDWLWFKNCLVNILAFFHLYTPTPLQRFNSLRDNAAEHNKPPMPSFAHHFGLFSRSGRAYQEPGSQHAQEELNNMPPSARETAAVA
ncbi:hypothetical protein [Legionella erythra]|uniref:SdhA, substrate of the Dot/Icm system n=2 Tax=Legionella erythra TaxID=448 RepID=A0A0W0TFI2_LEGER|nr:hypothetical protein [Legionella erythra]KTC94369.1 SdhA, substrate of the Dot/Icm system [Legionella erythra]